MSIHFSYYVLLMMAALANTAQAQGVYVGGEGIVECGEYLKARQDNSETQVYIYATWVRGFISGYNVATSGKPTPKIPATETILAYLDKHCREHPLDVLVTGAVALVKEAGGTRK